MRYAIRNMQYRPTIYCTKWPDHHHSRTTAAHTASSRLAAATNWPRRTTNDFISIDIFAKKYISLSIIAICY